MDNHFRYRIQIAHKVMLEILGYKAGRRYFTWHPVHMLGRLGRSVIGLVMTPIAAPVIYIGSAVLAGHDMCLDLSNRDTQHEERAAEPLPPPPSTSSAVMVSAETAEETIFQRKERYYRLKNDSDNPNLVYWEKVVAPGVSNR